MAKKNTSESLVPITRADLRANTGGQPATALALPGMIPSQGFVMPKGAIIKSMSPMVRPSDFPVGMVLVGKFTKMFETNPTPKKKGVGIEIVPEGSPVGVAIPAVATIIQGLEITGSDTGRGVSPHLGKTVAIERMEKRLKSKKGQDAWHFVCAILPDGVQLPGMATPGHVAAVTGKK